MPSIVLATLSRLYILVGCSATLGFSLGPLVASELNQAERSHFENRIRPILVTHCYECHSADAKKIGGKLLLDSPDGMLNSGESGPALTPGDADASLIIQALRYEGLEMPPKHPLPTAVIADFVAWVEMGAPDPRENLPSVATVQTGADPASLWAYQPLSHPSLPKVTATHWPRSSIDRWTLQKMEQAGLQPAQHAAPTSLIRRLHYDLVGLPPLADEVDAFVESWSEEDPVASNQKLIQNLVDRLLSSPHFGERWGRHWLDVARYAESNGNDGLSRNPSFPHAWRYRDYVIQAFNDDLPYDRFITEQIAGDLLPAKTAEQRDRHRIATGFLALSAKPAKAMNDNFLMDVVADQVDVVGSGILGLSIACARCHDHKTDPISTKEFYAMAGIFKSSETLWGAAAFQGLTAPQTPLHELETLPGVGPHPQLEAVFASYKARRPPAKASFPYPASAGLAMGVRDAKEIDDCKLNIGGESKKLGPAIPRGFLQAAGFSTLAVPIDPKQSGRLQLAAWLTHRDNPLTARVLVNRVWLNLFGHGIVRTPDDFGVFGERPSHPELLDHLAASFIEDGWSIKKLIRQIVLSRTYQLASNDPASHQLDPSNDYFARQTLRRLDAEALRDTMLACAGELNRQPAKGSLIQSRDVLINELGSLHQPSNHRSIYLLMLRNSMPPELTPFNLPDAVAVTGQRDSATLAPQSLYLLNSAFVVELSQRFAKRLIASSSRTPESRIREAYRSAFGRYPSTLEQQRGESFIREIDLSLVSHQAEAERSLIAWTAFCQALLASNELRYLD